MLAVSIYEFYLDYQMTPKRNGILSRYFGTIAVLAILALLASGYVVYAKFINVPPAQVYIAQRGTAIAAVYGTVSIQSVLTLPVNAQNSGYIHIDPALGTTVTSQGVHVKKDQLMATITDEPTSRALVSARTDAEAAAARLKLGAPSQGVLQSAKDKLAAYQKLPMGADGVPKGVARVDFESAKNEVARLQGAVDNEKLEAQRQLDNASSAVKTVEDQLKHTEVRSPLDGTLTAQMFNDNSYVTNTLLLFTVASDDKYVSGQVNEEDVGKLIPGMKAELRLYAYANTVIAATVSAILPTPDPNNSRYSVTLTLNNPPDNLLFGLTGEMNIILGRKEGALIIPARALLIDQVLIVSSGEVEQRTVKIGFKSIKQCEILEGIKEGEEVIVSDQDSFQPGERVRAVKTNEVSSESSAPKKKS